MKDTNHIAFCHLSLFTLLLKHNLSWLPLLPQLTNTLQKKLNEVRREKSLLEKQIEREHSSNSDLKARLDSLMEAASVSTASSSVMDEK